MGRPTDDAKDKFDHAAQHIMAAGQRLARNPSTADRQYADSELARGLWDIAVGLGLLSTGLRATYILLEEVQASIGQKKK